MNRRGFLGTCLALGVAPSIVRASSLMPVIQHWHDYPVGAWPYFWCDELIEEKCGDSLIYSGSFGFQLPPELSSRALRFWANGVELERAGKIPDYRNEGRTAWFKNINLTAHGNRIPDVSVRVQTFGRVRQNFGGSSR